MGLEGLASVRSRIADIQARIASLSNQGRPPVAVTELNGKNPTGNLLQAGTSADLKPSDTPFASEYSKQISDTPIGESSLFYGRKQIQGSPGTAEAFVNKVKSYLGVPYVWGGTNPASGLDCSGLVQTAAREVGVKLPRVTYDQQHAGVAVDGIENAKPGDLIICHKSGHVAVYIGDGIAIHAPRPGKNVTEVNVKDLGSIDTIRRVMRSEGDADTPTLDQKTVAQTRAQTRRQIADAQMSLLMNLAPASNSADLASSLVSTLSGSGATGTNPAGYAGTLRGSIGTTSANTALLSQLLAHGNTETKPLWDPENADKTRPVGSTLPAANALRPALEFNRQVGGTSATETASSLTALSALRSSLGV